MSIPKSRESDVVKACLEWLYLKGVFAWRNNTTGVYDPVRGCFRRFQGMKGASDIIGVLPATETAAGGRFLGVECKSARGRLAPHQLGFLEAVERMGGLAVCVRSLADLEHALAEAGY